MKAQEKRDSLERVCVLAKMTFGDYEPITVHQADDGTRGYIIRVGHISYTLPADILDQGTQEVVKWLAERATARHLPQPSEWDRGLILSKAGRLIHGDRQEIYGDADSSFAGIGQAWGAMLGGEPIPASKVALMMVVFKALRGVRSPNHVDNYIDIAGYAALGGEIARIDYEEEN